METSTVKYFGGDISSEGQRLLFDTAQVVRSRAGVVATDKYISMALSYLYRKGTQKVKHFGKSKMIEKISVEKEGILLSKGRLLDDMNFHETAKLPRMR